MIKNILILGYKLFTSPKQAWSEIECDTGQHEVFLKTVFYPLLGVLCLSAFAGEFFNETQFSVEFALKKVVISFVKLFGSLHLASYLLDLLYSSSLFGGGKSYHRNLTFLGYCYVPVMFIMTIIQLFSTLFFLGLFYFVLPYIILEGYSRFFNIDDKKRIMFVSLVSAIVLASPYILNKLMFLLMPGMRV